VHDGIEPPDACPVCGAAANHFEPVSEAADAAPKVQSGGSFVIIGGGIAGVAALEYLRQVSTATEITLVSKEPGLPYLRLNLTRYLAGEIGAPQLPIHPESWYEKQNVRLMLGIEARAIRLKEQTVELSDGNELHYERLLLAAGAHPFVPPFPGSHRIGVTTLRTIDDADRILRATEEGGAKCVCIGGGILGLETAAALARRGADVTLLEGHGWLLPRQLNRRAGELLAKHASAKGINVRNNARSREILGDDHVRGVLLEDDTVIPADLVVIATGIRSNSHLARSAGLQVNRGVVVDDTLRTSDPTVFAAGDIAEHRGVVYGIWGPSQAQGRIVAMNMAGTATEFGGVPRSNTLKVLGLDLFSIGQIHSEDASFDEVHCEDDSGYFRFLLRDSHLVGAILLGDATLAARIQRAMESCEDFSEFAQRSVDARELVAYLRE
jgi:nitrite reductase (NADH) large subunit